MSIHDESSQTREKSTGIYYPSGDPVENNFLYENHEIIKDLLPQKMFQDAGVNVQVSPQGFAFRVVSPSELSNIFSEEVFLKYKNTLGYGEILKEWQSSLSQDEKHLLSILLEKQHIGGANITKRNLESLDKLMVAFIAKKQPKKIVFIGNGFSKAPAQIKDVLPKTQVVIGDLFNYSKLEKAFAAWIKIIKQNYGYIPSTIQEIYENITALQKKTTITPPFKFSHNGGVHQLPRDFLNSDIVVNYMGPPISTLQQQLAMLKSGGYLFVFFDNTGNSLSTIPGIEEFEIRLIDFGKDPSKSKLHCLQKK